jgi:hypothetical protein
MLVRLLALLALIAAALLDTVPANAQLTEIDQWAFNSSAVPCGWARGGTTLDMDFVNDRYCLSGTGYTAGSGNTGAQNFITGAGATFTRAGTTNVTSTSSPFYLTSTESFVSRASVTNNLTSTFAPFYMTAASQSFVSRAGATATYFDSTGTLQTASANTARNATYSYNGSSWVANTGTLIEPAATNSIRNNTMVGAVASSSTQLANNGTFTTSCSGSTCSGWTTTVNGGTGSVSFSSGTATLTGDGTHAASIYQAITTVSGYTYTIAVTTGSGNAVTVQAGTSAGASGLLAATSIPASATTSVQFTATGTTSYVQINNTSVSAAAVTTVSVQSAGHLPTNWGFISGAPLLVISVVGSGTENGINYIDLNIAGTAAATGESAIYLDACNGVTAAQGQTWVNSAYLKAISGTVPTQSLLGVREYATGCAGILVEDKSSNLTIASTALGTSRQPYTVTLSKPTTTTVIPELVFGVSSGTAYNFTLRIGMPQMEQVNTTTSQATTATSIIATSTVAVTRSADVYNQQPASYFDTTGTLNFANTNVARTNYTYNGSSWTNAGTLIEPAATNSILDNMMVGMVAADGVERTNNGTFSNTSPNVCTGSVTSGSNTLSCYNGNGTGWVGTVNSGTGTASASAGNISLTGDGTNAASIYQAITTVSGYTYTIAVTTGSGQPVTVQAGTSAGDSSRLAASTAAASATTSYQFFASGTTSYVQINNASASAASVTVVSVKSAGAMPSSWNSSIQVAPGVAASVIGTGTENGISYVDINWSGTATTTGACAVRFANTTNIAASNGQAWTTSFYIKLQSGSLSGITGALLLTIINTFDSSHNQLGATTQANFTATGAGLDTQRQVYTATLTQANTANIIPLLSFFVSSGNSVNVTLRIGMPQTEQSSYATSVIPTFGSAVTRTADVYSVPSGGTYFDNTGTLQMAAINTPRLDHSPTGNFWPEGILIEESRTNSITNNMMVRTALSSTTQLATNGTFTSCSGSTCTGWTTTVNGGTGTVSFGSNTATQTGDGTNAASIYQVIPTIANYYYTIAVTTGSGNAVTVQAGSSAGASDRMAASTAAASTTTSYQFSATGSTSYVQINNTSATAATVTTVSVQSAGELPAGWSFCCEVANAVGQVVGTGTESGISYVDKAVQRCRMG